MSEQLKKCYTYDGTTKEYLYENIAQYDELESKKQKRDIYAMPPNSTFAIPPAKQKGKAIVFNGSWSYVNDYRGCLVLSNNTVSVNTELGDVQGMITPENISKYDFINVKVEINDISTYMFFFEYLESENLYIDSNGIIKEKPEPTIQEQLEAKENEYQMNRWQREGILAQNSEYSDYTKNKAQELEDLAEELRKKKK